jgi:hypothetical protein
MHGNIHTLKFQYTALKTRKYDKLKTTETDKGNYLSNDKRVLVVPPLHKCRIFYFSVEPKKLITKVLNLLRQCGIFFHLLFILIIFIKGASWPWSYGSWIYNYLCNQCLSPLMLRVRISIRARCTTLCDKVCHWLATGLWFSPGTPVSSSNKTDRNDITEILLKVA